MKALIDPTWPAAATRRHGPWLVREGAGGGQRVSSASAADDWSEADIALAEAAQDALGQPRLFRLWDEEERLEQALVARGYQLSDPTVIYSAEAAELAGPGDSEHDIFAAWPPLAIQTEIWAAGGIDAARLAVMDRVQGPKTALLARDGEAAAGVAFVALHEDQAMLHALEVDPAYRRRGLGGRLLRAAAKWAADQGAAGLGLLVTRANVGAIALYERHGMRRCGAYHYRVLPPASEGSA